MEKDRVSVLISSFKRPEALASCLGAIERQIGGLDIEVCVVNDGGPSIAHVIHKFPGLRTIYRDEPVNRGQVYCRNQALNMATGEWIAICDDDDRYLPNHLANMFQAAKAAPIADHKTFVYADVEIVILQVGQSAPRVLRRIPFAWRNAGEILDQYNPIVPSSVFYHHSLHEQVGQFDDALGHYWDWDFWLRLRGVTALERVPYCSVLYSMDNIGSNQSADPNRMRTDLEKLIAKHGLVNLPSSNFMRMTEDPVLREEAVPTTQLWNGDVEIWT